MEYLIKNAKVVFPGSSLHNQTIDLHIKSGKIMDIGPSITASNHAKVIEGKNLLVFPGLFDMQAFFGDPGFEDKESIESGLAAAKSGGFTEVMITPDTDPEIDAKGAINYIQKKSAGNDVKVHICGALSKKVNGAELSEMYDMKLAGAVAFGDGKKPVKDVNLMKRALDYVKSINSLVVSFPLEERLAPGGMVHEGVVSTKLGLKPMPAIAEQLMVDRDLLLLGYTGSRLHFSTISTQESIELIMEARKNGRHITCGAALANLVFTDQTLEEFDTNFKVLPSLREEEVRKALVAALKRGDIDVIVSDHRPETLENKVREFDHASYGMSTIETALSWINMYLVEEIGWDTVVRAMAINPRKILGIDLPQLEKGQPANITLFDPDVKWSYGPGTAKSKGRNNPSWGLELVGRAITL